MTSNQIGLKMHQKIREKRASKFMSEIVYALRALREKFGSLIKRHYSVGFPKKTA